MKISKTMHLAVLVSLLMCGSNMYSFAQNNVDFNAKVITVANTVSYLTIDAKHSDSKVKSLYLDGTPVDFSRVSSDGKIVKTEFDGKHKKAKIIFENGKELEKDILGVYNKFQYKSIGNSKAPDIVWGHVTIPVTDFHKVARDKNGIEIKLPTTTLIDIEEDAKPIEEVEKALPSKTNDIDSLDTEVYLFNGDENISVLFDNTKNRERRYFKKIFSIRVYDGNKVVKSKIRFSKQNLEDKGKIVIDKKELESLDYGKNYILKLKFRGSRSLNIVIQKARPSKVEANPNPKEVLSDKIINYGEDILINYDLTNKKEREKFNSVVRVVKEYDDANKHSEDLQYSKSQSKNTGTIRVRFAGSSSLHKRGDLKIKIMYPSENPDIKEYTMKDRSPKIMLNSENGTYKIGKSLVFTLKGYEYLFQQDTGIESVYINGTKLTRKYVPNADEKIEELREKGIEVAEDESENPFYVVGNLLRIKGEGKKFLRTGVNYLTVKYKNFHDSNMKFMLEADESNHTKLEEKSNVEPKLNSEEMGESTATTHSILRRAKRSAKVNVISSATSGGASRASVASDSESGGTINMGAKLIYDFDMVANASIVESLGYQSQQAKKVMDYWEGTAKEVAAFKNNANRRVDWDSYMNYVQDSMLSKGLYTSFSYYYNSTNVELNKNIPHLVKYVLPNGIGLPIYNQFDVFIRPENEENIPKNIYSKLDSISVREDIELPLDHWTNSIVQINVDDRILTEGEDYIKDMANSKFVIYGKNFDVSGNHTIRIKLLGHDEVVKELLVKSEVDIDTPIRIIPQVVGSNNILPGKALSFQIDLADVEISSAILIKDGNILKRLENNEGYKYYKSLGMYTLDGSLISDYGNYKIRFILKGRGIKEIPFDITSL